MTQSSNERATKTQWIGLVLLVLPMLMVASDLTVLFLALPTITAELEPSASQALWITHIYGFVIASILVTVGRLGDRIGPKKLLLIGATLFGIFSTVAAFSANPEMLIAARALMGVGGATLMPSLFSLLRTMFADENQRRLAISVMMGAFTVGAAIGPVMGGALLELVSWGAVFLINVPFMMLLVVCGPWLLPERLVRNSARLDLPGVVLSAAGILALVYGLQELAAGAETGEGFDWSSLAVSAAGALLLTVFVRRQLRVTNPLFDVGLLKTARIGAPIGAFLLVSISTLGMFFLITQYLQLVIGLTPLMAGVATLPQAAASLMGAMLAPALAKHMRPAVVVTFGVGLIVVGAALLGLTIGPNTSPMLVLGFLAVLGLGQGSTAALLTDMIISNAPEEKTGSVSAANEVGGELGHAVGIAAGGAVGTVIYRTALEPTIPAEVPEDAADAALSSLHSGVTTAEGLSTGGPALLEAVHEAISIGLQSFAIIAAIGVALATLLVTIVLVIRDGPHRRCRSDSSAQDQRSDESLGREPGSVPVKQPVQGEYDDLSG